MENVYQFIVDLFVGNGVIISVGTFVVGMIIKTSITKLPKNIYL